MLKKYHFIDWQMNQKVFCKYLYSLDNYVFCEEFNEEKKHIGYRVSLQKRIKLKKTIIGLENQKFNNVYQLLKHLKESHKVIEICSSKKIVVGYILDLTERYLLMQLLDYDSSKNGILILLVNYIDTIFWDNDQCNRLERLVAYSKEDIKIDEVLLSYNERLELCEVYHSGFETFILGACKKVAEDYYLIESINLQDEFEGFVLIHTGLIDYICLRTKYIKTYHMTNNINYSFACIADFLNFIICNNKNIDITLENKKEYKKCILISFDNEKIIVETRKKRKIIAINAIDILDACEK